jgi:cystathionine beta-lyase
LKLAQLRRRTSLKWRSYPEDVLPMWVAEMDAPVAPAVREAVADALGRGDVGYACGDSYAQALASFALERWGWSVPPGQTSMVPDVMLGAVELLKLVTEPGDGVVVNPPVYPPFYMFVEHMDRRIVTARLSADGRLDLDRLSDAFRSAKAFLLCNPHNPTGTVHTPAELSAVAELAAAHGVTVVADEIHAPLVLPGARFTPYLSVSDNGFSVMSASKGWNLAGLKAAVAIAGAASVDRLAQMPEEVSHGVSHLGVIAHAAALLRGREWLDTLLLELDGNRALLADLLAQRLPEIGFRPPDASYLAWLDCRALGLEVPPADILLERGRIALNAGETFGEGGQGHVRMNLGTSPELIAEGVERMVAALAK